MHKKIAKAVAVFFLAALIPASCFAYDIAKKEGTRHTHKSTVESDLDKDGALDKITLVKPEPSRDFTDFDIVKDATLRIEERGQVFSAPLADEICYKSSGLENVVIADNVNPFIAVSSCVPRAEDEWALTLYSFDGKTLAQQLRVTSNEPSIEIKDADNDGVKDIVVIDRDYENDPTIDKFITTYKYINGKWQRASVYRTKTKEFTKK